MPDTEVEQLQNVFRNVLRCFSCICKMETRSKGLLLGSLPIFQSCDASKENAAGPGAVQGTRIWCRLWRCSGRAEPAVHSFPSRSRSTLELQLCFEVFSLNSFLPSEEVFFFFWGGFVAAAEQCPSGGNSMKRVHQVSKWEWSDFTVRGWAPSVVGPAPSGPGGATSRFSLGAGATEYIKTGLNIWLK